MSNPTVSIIIPVLNEADRMASLLDGLPPGTEIIVADGHSDDDSARIAARHGARVISTARGRAVQMNAGAAQARGDVLLFLHADTELPEDFLCELGRFQSSRKAWGRFDIHIGGRNLMYRLIERMMNLRSSLTGVCTGDQAMFVRREIFEEVGGFPPIPLMEDIEMSRKLGRYSRPFIVKSRVRTSPRRWREGGIVSTILLMWRLRLAYFLGVKPDRLVGQYYE